MSARRNPKKPYADFLLFAHANGQWAKKIRGRLLYFGKDANAALEKYLDEKDDRQAGRTPRQQEDGLTVRDLCNQFLTSKKRLVESEELAPQTWRNYYDVCERLAAFFGTSRLVIDPANDDFERLRSDFAKKRGPSALMASIQKVRTIMKFAYDANLITRPVRFGPSFRKPSKKAIRQARHASGKRMFEAAELRVIMNESRQPLSAITLLAINCTDGAKDVSACISWSGPTYSLSRVHRKRINPCNSCFLLPYWASSVSSKHSRRSAIRRPFRERGGSWSWCRTSRTG